MHPIGGPAGMMAAQTLRERGHEVTLYEKSDRLGGLLLDATAPPFKEYMRLYLDWDIRTTMASGARIVLNTAVTPELVEREDPDAVIVATGSTYFEPNIPGIDSAKVLRLAEVEHGEKTAGDSVVICGGGLVGLECAVMLCEQGKTVTVIDMIPTEAFGGKMSGFNLVEIDHRLRINGVVRIGDRRVTAFTEAGVQAVDSEGNEYTYPADSYILAMGVRPEDTLAQQLLASYPEGVYVVGDCTGTGRMLGDANHEAFDAAIRI